MATRDISDYLVVKAYDEFSRYEGRWIIPGCPFPYGYLMEWTGLSFKECYGAMMRAEKRGFIEYGTSLKAGWLTDKGKKLLLEGENEQK